MVTRVIWDHTCDHHLTHTYYTVRSMVLENNFKDNNYSVIFKYREGRIVTLGILQRHHQKSNGSSLRWPETKI